MVTTELSRSNCNPDCTTLKYTNVTVVQVFQPTNTASDEEKYEFYELLQQLLKETHG